MSLLCMLFACSRLEILACEKNTIYDEDGATKAQRESGDVLPIRRETYVTLRCPRCGDLSQVTLRGHFDLNQIRSEPQDDDPDLARLRKMAGL